jgi:tetratricopeptide (TPR) repeat protein
MRFLLVAFLAVGFHASPASAQPTTSAEQFEKGKAAYRLGEFDEAIAFFREGYRLKADPVFLYNIALAHRGKQDFEKAIFFYQSYLREAPEAANRASVEAKIADLQRALDEKKRAAEAPPKTPLDPGKPTAEEPAAVTPKVPVPVVAVPVERKRNPTLIITGGTVAGVGLAASVVGAVLLAKASSTQREVDDAAERHLPWTEELADKDASARRNAKIGLVAVIAGGTLVVGGGVVLFLGLRTSGGTEVLPTASSDGAGVVFRGSF